MVVNFVWDNVGLVNTILGFVLVTIIYLIIGFVFAKVVKRTSAFVFLGICFASMFIGFLFDIAALMITAGAATATSTIISLFTNIGDLRHFLANPFKRTNAKAANFGIEKIFDRKELYETVSKAVKQLSATRTGAIITFEKETDLKDIIRNGVPVHAPVTAELLETIFFPGTRLHDGAVVIHGNEVVAANVFFTPTTKPFAGRYGSRHRAAVGVSEVSDAVTVVVSEETGRISFAINGELEIVSPDNFQKVLENYMGYED